MMSLTLPSREETSLRMQRKLLKCSQCIVVYRNISAHAEKTALKDRKIIESKKHLCACRENQGPLHIGTAYRETSLRMQRKLPVCQGATISSGNISAHAEKTLYDTQL